MKPDTIKAREPLSQLLEKTRAILNAVLATRPDVFSWAQYRAAEVLYAQGSLNKAVSAVFSNELARSEGYLEEVKHNLDILEKLLQQVKG